ncbi:MAG TPA: ABC transporter ATP-binding protein [Dehalococcoidia bacterium]|nr:ABC transporter ATP-binding protein [Dehalococcoidia bacterium]
MVKVYSMGSQRVVALGGVSLSIQEGEFVAIMGASGSGKSTLMHILGCLDQPTSGLYELDGVEVSRLTDDDLAAIRSRKIGFVFQSFNLLPRFPAVEQVALPLVYSGTADRRRLAQEALTSVGLSHRLGHGPTELSGGEQQRVAIARALVTSPRLILADEPTGNLDTRSSEEIMETFRRLNEERALTIVLVTHEHDIAAFAHRVIQMRDGQIVADERN